MVRKIVVEEIVEFPKSELGRFPTEADYDEIIDEDADVYLPDGTLAIVFRKSAVKSLVEYHPDTAGYAYWKWASQSLYSDQRGAAAGAEIYTSPEIRFTHGQLAFYKEAAAGNVVTFEQARELILSDTRLSRETYYFGKTKDAALFDVEAYLELDKRCKKATDIAERRRMLAERNEIRASWFDNWLEREWAVAEDKVAMAKLGKKTYKTSQPRGNAAYSAVLGAITRSARTPYARMTKPTLERWDEFFSEQHVYQEIDSLVRKYMPERWQILHDRFQQVKDERYNLFGTAFTSITVNYNFQVACHVDGQNAKNALAVLSALDNGKFDGFDFVIHPLRLAFRLRHGDFWCGDNQSTVHSITEMMPHSTDAESITIVMYQRDAIIKVDDLKCEQCRKDFIDWSKLNLQHLGTGEKNWAGSFPHMFSSPYWEDFKKENDMEHCSNTSYWGNPDEWPGEEAVLLMRTED